MMVCGELKATPAEVKALRVKAGWRLLFHYYIPVHTVHPQVTDACSVLNKPKKRIQDTIQAEEHYIRCRWKGHREEGVYASCPHSRPKVLVSSTAISSFSYNMVYDGYGGRSRRLKHVCALRNRHDTAAAWGRHGRAVWVSRQSAGVMGGAARTTRDKRRV